MKLFNRKEKRSKEMEENFWDTWKEPREDRGINQDQDDFDVPSYPNTLNEYDEEAYRNDLSHTLDGWDPAIGEGHDPIVYSDQDETYGDWEEYPEANLDENYQEEELLGKRAKYSAKMDTFLNNGIIIVGILLLGVLLIAFLV